MDNREDTAICISFRKQTDIESGVFKEHMLPAVPLKVIVTKV